MLETIRARLEASDDGSLNMPNNVWGEFVQMTMGYRRLRTYAEFKDSLNAPATQEEPE